MSLTGHVPHLAIVSRCDPATDGAERYLRLTEGGAPLWIDDPEAATAFESLREAQRAATRLPASLRAYGMPHKAELICGRALN